MRYVKLYAVLLFPLVLTRCFLNEGILSFDGREATGIDVIRPYGDGRLEKYGTVFPGSPVSDEWIRENILVAYRSTEEGVYGPLIRDLQEAKRREIRYLGSSYGVPVFIIRAYTSRGVNVFRQIPIEEITAAFSRYEHRMTYTILRRYLLPRRELMPDLVATLAKKSVYFYGYDDIGNMHPDVFLYSVRLEFSSEISFKDAAERAERYGKSLIRPESTVRYSIKAGSSRGTAKRKDGSLYDVFYSSITFRTRSKEQAGDLGNAIRADGYRCAVDDRPLEIFIEEPADAERRSNVREALSAFEVVRP